MWNTFKLNAEKLLKNKNEILKTHIGISTSSTSEVSFIFVCGIGALI